MRRLLATVVLILLLAVCMFGPLFETVDHWDQFPQSGNDIVLSIVLAVALLAFCLCTTLRLVWLFASIFPDVKGNGSLTHLRNVFLRSNSLDALNPLKLCTALRI